MRKSMLKKYAALAVRVGANVQKGTSVILSASLDQEPLVAEIVKECYSCGAKTVRVDWQSDRITRIRYQKESLKSLSTVLPWEEERQKQMVADSATRILIESSDPECLAGINQKKLGKVTQARSTVFRPYRQQMEGHHCWLIIGAASKAWAKKVFPDLPPKKAVDALWEAIFAACHLTADSDPVAVWAERDRSFKEKSAWLNERKFVRMEYHAKNGTDFTADLLDGVRWDGGSETTVEGVSFQPNLPTEEIFTTPWAGHAEGTLVATKPLSYNGRIIDRFSITFRDGKAVSWTAEQGKEVLDELFRLDEGARRLGELSLVPKESPINVSEILYQSTLFDENACCHVALGFGFPNLLDGYETMTPEQLEAYGINESLTHVDFMIGCDDLSVTGITADGERVPVFVNGTWAETSL